MNEDFLYKLAEKMLCEAAETNEFLKTLDMYHQKKYGENYPDRNLTDNEYRQLVIDAADEMGFTPTDPALQPASASCKKYIEAHINDVQREQPQQTSTSASNDIKPKNWPKYNEFRKKWYKQTVDLGWPKNFRTPDYRDNEVVDGIVYPWGKFNSAYIFKNRGTVASFKNYTKKIKDYLYTKFENDVPGLKKLSDKVDSIIEVEKQFLKKKPMNIMGQLAMSVFKGLGATANDEAIFKWMAKTFTGMTIFEYQKMILDEMYTKMSVSDTTSKALSDLLQTLYANVKNDSSDNYKIDKVKTVQDLNEKAYKASFDITPRTGRTKVKLYDPYVHIIETVVFPLLQGKYNSASKRKLKCNFTEEELKKLIDELNASVVEQTTGKKTVDEVIKNSKPIIFEMADLNDKGEVIGIYKIYFNYFVKGCKISVVYKPKE